MDDTAAGVAVGLIAALVLHGSLNRRAAFAAERQMREAFTGPGAIHAVVREQAPFGILGNDLWAIDVYCDHVSADTVPFTQSHRSGWKGRIHHLRLHLRDCGFAGLKISSLDADIPSVTYDLGHALYRERLLIRQAGAGTVRITIDQSNLEEFAQHKFGKTVSNVKAVLTGDHLSIKGDALLLSSKVPFTIEGTVGQSEGRYVEITDAAVTLNGAVVDSAQAKGMLDRINPVLDVKTDLNLDRVIRVRRVTGAGNQMIIEGEMFIPDEQLQKHRPLVSDGGFEVLSPGP